MKADKDIVEGYLAEMARGETESGFCGLYEYTYDLLYVFVLSIIKNRCEAEDAVQDSYIKILRNIQKYHPGTNGLAWMIQIAKNTALNYNEKQGKMISVEYGTKTKSHEDKVAEADYLDYVFKKLSAKERQVVALHIYGDCTIKEAAAFIGITVTTAEWRYRTAMKKLKASLAKDGVYHG